MTGYEQEGGLERTETSNSMGRRPWIWVWMYGVCSMCLRRWWSRSGTCRWAQERGLGSREDEGSRKMGTKRNSEQLGEFESLGSNAVLGGVCCLGLTVWERDRHPGAGEGGCSVLA